jgi:hypothetical protein
MVVMGRKDRAFAPLPPVTLADLVPPDHFYRHLERTLDLGFVRDLVHGTYAEAGRPSIDPVVFFKSQLVMFFEGIRSERQLIAAVRAIRKRQVWVEPRFAEAKEWQGLRRLRLRLRLRELMNANIQGLLIATGQNPKRWPAATGWSRRLARCGSLIVLPVEPLGLLAVPRS